MPSDRRGTEPTNARSPLRTRMVLSAIILPIALAAAVYFGYEAATTGATVWAVETGIAALAALIAAIDLAVLAHRIRQARRGR